LCPYRKDTPWLPFAKNPLKEACNDFLERLKASDAKAAPGTGRGLHSSAFRLNVSAFCGIGGAFRCYVGGIQAVSGGVKMCTGCIIFQKRLRLSWKVDECKPLGTGTGSDALVASAVEALQLALKTLSPRLCEPALDALHKLVAAGLLQVQPGRLC
jgi:hypothetical protein